MYHYRCRALRCRERSRWPYNRNVARGFESKSVESQQEEAARSKKKLPRRNLTPEQNAVELRRSDLELTRVRARNDLKRATVPAHRRMLEQAIAELDRQLDGLATPA